MAIYHFHCDIGTKLEGDSAGAKCAYITRTEAYAKKSDECAYSASGNMPKWPKTNPQDDPAHYWKAADIYERDNGRLFRELEISLPRELNLEQQKALCHAFSEKATTLKEGLKLPFTFSIHTDKDNHNPHFHLMISERVNDGINRNASTWFKRANPKDPKKGGAIKTQELNGPRWLNPARETWANLANEALKNSGTKATIDHRSYENQGVETIPQKHLGPTCDRMIKKGQRCDYGRQTLKDNERVRAANVLQKKFCPVPRRPFKRMIVQSLRVCHVRVSSPMRKDGTMKSWEEILNDLLSSLNSSIQAWIKAQGEQDRLRSQSAGAELAIRLHASLPTRANSMDTQQSKSGEVSGLGSHFKPSSATARQHLSPFNMPRKPTPK